MRPWRSTMSPVTPACSGASKSVTLCPAGSDRVQLADRLLGAEERAGYPTVIRWRVSEASDQASSQFSEHLWPCGRRLVEGERFVGRPCDVWLIAVSEPAWTGVVISSGRPAEERFP